MVLKFGLDPEYVLDKMEVYEIDALFKYQHYKTQEQWEQARLGAYMTAQVNSKNRIHFQDIVKFKWEEEEEEEEKDTSISKADISRLKERAEKFIKQQQEKE